MLGVKNLLYGKKKTKQISLNLTDSKARREKRKDRGNKMHENSEPKGAWFCGGTKKCIWFEERNEGDMDMSEDAGQWVR